MALADDAKRITNNGQATAQEAYKAFCEHEFEAAYEMCDLQENYIKAGALIGYIVYYLADDEAFDFIQLFEKEQIND